MMVRRVCGYCGGRFDLVDPAIWFCSDECLEASKRLGASDAPDSPSTGLEDLSDSELASRLEVSSKRERDEGWRESADTLAEAARRLRLRVPTGLSDAEILERAADVFSRWGYPIQSRLALETVEELRSEQNTQKPTKEKDAND